MFQCKIFIHLDPKLCLKNNFENQKKNYYRDQEMVQTAMQNQIENQRKYDAQSLSSLNDEKFFRSKGLNLQFNFISFQKKM